MGANSYLSMKQNKFSDVDARRADRGTKRRTRARTADTVDSAPSPTVKRHARHSQQKVSWRVNASRSINDAPVPTLATSDDSISDQFCDRNRSNQGYSRHHEYLHASSSNSMETNLLKIHDWARTCFSCCHSYEFPETPKKQPSMSMREMIDDLLDHESPHQPGKRKGVQTKI
jgi:hypothetical protein